MNRDEWNKFVKVFSLDVDVTVKKEVSKADVILSLLDEGEIAFKGARGEQFLLKLHEGFTFDLLKQLIWNPIREYQEKIKSPQKQEKKL